MSTPATRDDALPLVPPPARVLGAASSDADGDPSLLVRIVGHLQALTGGATGWAVRVDEAAGTWTVPVGTGDGRATGPPDAVVGEIVHAGGPVILPGGPEGRELLGVPVRRGPRVVGACLVVAGRRAFGPADTDLAELVAEYAALALADGGTLGGRSMVTAVRDELAWTERASTARTDLVTVGAGTLEDPDAADEVFRIAQEALLNAAVHAGASRVQVGVLHGPGTLTVLVEDDGRGFDVEAHAGLHEAARGSHLGLRAMTARARRLDGELEIDSAPGRGTRLRLTVPCAPSIGGAASRGRPSVLVAVRRPVLRAGVVRLLQLGEPGLGMVSEVGDGDDVVGVSRLLAPDVLVVEPDLLGDPDSDVADPVRALERIAALPTAPAVVLLAGDYPADRLRAAVTAGVKGCVGPDAGAERLGAVVSAAGRGETLLADDQLGRLAARTRAGGVTARERQVCELVAQGCTDRQIATALHISAKTVEKHVGSLLRKTGARNRTMLARLDVV